MIADDMMTYIKNDIIVFGAGVFLFIVCTLWFVFRNFIMGIYSSFELFFFSFNYGWFFGLVGWKVTVISSNFIALMLILTMAMNIHMSVRYLQFKKENPNISNSEATLDIRKNVLANTLYGFHNYLCFSCHLYLVILNLL